ncbi:MAG: DUF5343 domain-containing protein [Dehalococcoidia bacterium]|nr:DUF5343 domain-containing protein [Dehalococcoidia bacterium]
MSAENARRGTPPYISPVTFRHLLEQLQKNVPDRIDRSYLDELHSGSTGTQIMSAVRYLNLVDSNNKPTPNLRFLLDGRSTPEERTKKLRDIALSAYGFVLSNTAIDHKTATYAQIQELFRDNCGVEGDVQRKCIKFFTSLATDAGIPLSPFINKRVRMGRSTPPRQSTRKGSSKSSRNVLVPEPTNKIPVHMELLGKLLDKFPPFESEWTVEQKTRWLESFMVFIQKIYPPEPPK